MYKISNRGRGEKGKPRGRSLGIPPSIGSGRCVEDAEKGARKVALVVKAAIHSDRGNGNVALAKGGARLLDAVAIEVLDRG